MNPNFKLPPQLSSFSAYFELKARAEDIAAAWGYTLERSVIELPQTTEALPWVPTLQQRLTQETIKVHRDIGRDAVFELCAMLAALLKRRAR